MQQSRRTGMEDLARMGFIFFPLSPRPDPLSPRTVFCRFQEPIGNWRTRKRNTEAVPEIAAAAAKKKSMVRTVIVADSVNELPVDVKKKVMGTGVAEATLDMHFDILCTVLHFKLKHVFKTKVEAAKLNEKRGARKEHRKELLEAAAEVKASGRRPTRARAATMTEAPAQVVIQPKLMQWLGELETEADALFVDSDSSEEDGTATTDAGAEKAKKRKGVKERTRKDEIITLGSKLPGVGEPQAMRRKYKGWDQSGKGGFGTVYMTKDSGAKQLVAIKVMPHKSAKEQDTNFCEVFFLDTMRHPNIVAYYNSFVLPEEIWVAMEFLEGGTLSDACKSRPFKEDELAFVAQEMMRGVAYMHENHLAHRDIKSPNVMMSTSAEIKLIDFGLCRDMRDGQQVHMVGSPYWMPPEMIQKKPHGYPVDIWSTGICLLELMNGKAPNRDNSIRAMFLVGIGEAPEPAQPSKWSLECQKFIEWMLTVPQEERPKADELLKDPFLKKAASNKAMTSMLQQIFLNATFGSSSGGGGGGLAGAGIF